VIHGYHNSKKTLLRWLKNEDKCDENKCEGNSSVLNDHGSVFKVGGCEYEQVESEGEEKYANIGFSSDNIVPSDFVASSSLYVKNKLRWSLKEVQSISILRQHLLCII
jgi:hypothetical protein